MLPDVLTPVMTTTKNFSKNSDFWWWVAALLIDFPPCPRGGGNPIDSLLLPAKKNCRNSVFLINIWLVRDGIITVGAGTPEIVYINVEGVGHHSSYYCALGVFLEEPEPIWLKP